MSGKYLRTRDHRERHSKIIKEWYKLNPSYAENNHNYKHGQYGTRFYKIWINIRHRCCSPKCSEYPKYGGRGITICERWSDFKNFYEDMHPTYKEGLSIDRIDNNKGYEPSNCRWTNQLVQSNNTRSVENAKGYRKSLNKFRAYIKINGKDKNLGSFFTEEEAHNAYLKAKQIKLRSIYGY